MELLIALVVITIAASMAVPAFFGRSEVTLDNASHLFTHDLRMVQNRAAFRRIPIRAEFFEDGDGYGFRRGDGKPLMHPYNQGPFLRRFSSNGVFQGVTLAVEEIAEGGFYFRADGTPSGPLRVLFRYRTDVRMIQVNASGGMEILGGPKAWSSADDRD